MGDVIEQVKDVNGKEFSVDISKICDINGDMGNKTSASVSDNQKNRIHKVHDVEYYDQAGNAIDSLQLLKDMSSGKTNVLALDVQMEATHSGKNHNYCIYYQDSMEKDVESFTNPFKKPVLKNHNDYSGEPLGRITQAWSGESALTDERSAIHLKTRITDADAIPKFLDGRYGTVSISGTMGNVTCNICGKTILKDGKFKFCGHWRGETYKDEVCYWGAKDIEYHEVSTVNNPADDYAQIMKVSVLTDSEDKKDNKEENNVGAENTKPSTSDAQAADIKSKVCDMIDELLGKAAKDSNTPPPATTGETKDSGTGTDGENKAATTTDAITDSTNTEIEALKTQLADATAKLTASEAELATAKADLADSNKKLEESKVEVTDMKEKCIALATSNKEIVADSIILKEIAAGSIKEDAKDARKTELVGMSMKELNTLASKSNDSTDSKEQRQEGHVDNPTLANDDNKGVNGSADTHKTNEDKAKAAKKKNVNDYANIIVSKLVK